MASLRAVTLLVIVQIIVMVILSGSFCSATIIGGGYGRDQPGYPVNPPRPARPCRYRQRCDPPYKNGGN
ncbi:hypothetical protein GUJ93_ZPchr0006g45653 [Zizania palustris]|uniref:Uncharacterized protein n=1 Tax=Zizania palustris TaxID=103762 RepID=A0A8J5T954_ZIZPA|nr:hypothetical protein GUJ93_ZPchr0006g45653 [Zizania palustris]